MLKIDWWYTWNILYDDDVGILWYDLYKKCQDEIWVEFLYKENSTKILLNCGSSHFKIISQCKV